MTVTTSNTQSASQTGSASSPAMHAIRLLAIVVVYRTPPMQSSSLQTLLTASRAAALAGVNVSIVVADNTPGGQPAGEMPDGVRLQVYPNNPGLATPYNHAVQTAVLEGCEWLLTLDQDTHLPGDFLTGMADYARRYAEDSAVAAIVPQIWDHGRLISPLHFAGGWMPRVLPAETEGLCPPHTSALNSGSLLRVSALQQIGGYNPRFPLHNSDTDLYHRLDHAGRRVVVAHGMRINHELAILDRAGRMSVDRYRRMLADECDWWDLNMSALGRAERIARLAGRVAKGLIQGEAPAYRQVAFEECLRRLLTRRSARMRAHADGGPRAL